MELSLNLFQTKHKKTEYYGITRVFLWHYVNFGWATSRAKRDKNPTRIESEAEKRGKREGGGHTQSVSLMMM